MLIFYMQKIISLLISILFISTVSGEESPPLKLRASHHPEFLRIVIEGRESVISKAIVNQRDKDITVRFPSANFTIQTEKESVTYKKDKDIIFFSPGNFNKFKTFFLKNPERLVIDIYLKEVFSEQTSEKKPAIKIRTIVIDPGHGGYDSGIIIGDTKEKYIVLDIAKTFKAFVSKESISCFLTRESDRFMSLDEREKAADSKRPDIFLSIHIGKHNEIIIYTPVITYTTPSDAKNFLVNKGQEDFIRKTEALSITLKTAFSEEFGDNMVTIKSLPYTILSRIEAPAVMIELPSFEKSSYDPEYKKRIVNTIYKGSRLYEEDTES